MSLLLRVDGRRYVLTTGARRKRVEKQIAEIQEKSDKVRMEVSNRNYRSVQYKALTATLDHGYSEYWPAANTGRGTVTGCGIIKGRRY